MALFVLEGSDRPGALEVRKTAREAHLAWLGEARGMVKAGGALLDGEGAPCGSLLIVEAQDADAVRAWAAGDPYAAAGLFERVTVRPWRLAVGGGRRRRLSAARPGAGVRLCRLDDLPEPGARGFAFDPPLGAGDGAGPFRGLVVRRDGEVRGYVDSCPHVGAPLSADPDRYLTRRGDLLICFNHGALFRVDDGLCVAGPCVNRALRPWPVEVRDGNVVTA